MLNTANVDNFNADFDDTSTRVPSTKYVLQMKTKDDDSSIMAMRKDMDRLFTVLGDVEQEDHKCSNKCRLETFEVQSTVGEAEQYIDDKIAMDIMFCYKAVQISFYTFIGTALDRND